MRRGVGAWLLPALLASAAVQAQQPADSIETLAIRSMNICLASAAGGNVQQLAAAQGYEREENTYARRFGDRWLFFTAFPEPGGHGCRMTALRPNPALNDSLRYSQPGPVFADVERVMERLANGPLAFGSPFSVQYLREKHPARPGHLRTKLQRLTGDTLEVIYLEESHFIFEMVYAKGPRLRTGGPAMLDEVTNPEALAEIRQSITQQARKAYCASHPVDCRAADRVHERSASSSPATGTITPGGDNRSHVEKLRDKGWWENYTKRGRGKYD